MSDESKLKDKVGTENPFRVPEGYFASFQQQLLASLPERAAAAPAPVRASLWTKARPWLSAAAIVCGVVLAVGVYSSLQHPRQEALADGVEQSVLSDDEMSEYMATSFFDEYTLYTYLTGEEY